MLAEAGFTDAVFHGWTGYVTSSSTEGGLVSARKPAGGAAHERATPAEDTAVGEAGTDGGVACDPAFPGAPSGTGPQRPSRSFTPTVDRASNREGGSLAAQAIPRRTGMRNNGSSSVHA